MSETRPRRATIMVGLTALVAGAAIAGAATLLNLPDGESPQVPLVMGYNDAGNPVRQTGSIPPSESATALSSSQPATSGASSSSASSSASSSSSSASSSASSSSSTPPSEQQPQQPPPAPPQPTQTPENDSPGSPDAGKAAEVVALVNRVRPQCPISADDRLTTSAQKHSTDMANRNYFSHTTPDGVTFDQRIKAAGYPRPGAENIAKGQRTAEQVMDSWMRSDGHRRNILNCDYKKIGVGVDTRGFLWTQNFGF